MHKLICNFAFLLIILLNSFNIAKATDVLEELSDKTTLVNIWIDDLASHLQLLEDDPDCSVLQKELQEINTQTKEQVIILEKLLEQYDTDYLSLILNPGPELDVPAFDLADPGVKKEFIQMIRAGSHESWNAEAAIHKYYQLVESIPGLGAEK